MTKVTFSVVPQKSDGRAFMLVERHQATSFGVERTESFTRNGKPYTVKRIISRHARQSEAELEAAEQAARYAPRKRDYKLGKRMPKLEA